MTWMRGLFHLAWICLAIGVIGIAWRGNHLLSAATVPVQLQKQLDGTSYTQIGLQTDIADVELLRSDDETIAVKVSGEIAPSDEKYCKIETKTGANSLAIQVPTGSKGFHFDLIKLLNWVRTGGGRSHLTVALSVPDKIYDQLTVRTDTGSITAGNAQAKAMQLKSNTGRIELKQYAGSQLEIVTDTGAIQASGIQAHTAQLKSGTGQIALQRYTGGQLDVASDTGRLDLSEVQGAVRAKSNTGGMTLTAVRGGVKANTDTGKILISVQELSDDLAADSNTGSVTINLPANVPAFQADLHSNTGSVTLDVPEARYDLKEKHKVRAAIGSGGPSIEASTDTGGIAIGRNSPQ